MAPKRSANTASNRDAEIKVVKLDEMGYLSKILKKMSENANLSDFTLIAEKDGQRFDVHKCIMAAASEFCKGLFESNFLDSKNKEFIVRDVDGPSLKKIVDCCYTGCIELDPQCLFDIIKAANYLAIFHIESKCKDFLERKLRWEDCVPSYSIADSFGFTDLKKKSFELICKEFKRIPSEELQQLNAKLLLEVLKSDKIEAPEEMVFSKLKAWVNGSAKVAFKDVQELIGCIQLERISGEFLVKEMEVFCKKYKCTERIMDECRKRVIREPITAEAQRFKPKPRFCGDDEWALFPMTAESPGFNPALCIHEDDEW